MSFLRGLPGLSLTDWVRSSDVRRELGAETLLRCVKSSQSRWSGHLIRMPPGRLPLEVFLARPTSRTPGGPRTRWRDDYMSYLARDASGSPGGAGKLVKGAGQLVYLP